MNDLLKTIQDLLKATEAGNYDARPSTLTQGAALQNEALATKMENVCHQDEDIVLQKMFPSETAKSNTWQFNRQLSYGDFGGSAVMEGQIGPENTSKIVRVAIPMAYYVDQRRVTEQSLLVETFDGKKSDERAAEDAAMKIAGDVEFACFRGAEDFSNGGTFDGNPDVIPKMTPGMHGIVLQIRQSDALKSTQDQMFSEFGSAESVVFNVGGTLTQTTLEDMRARSRMNHGKAKDFCIDPLVHATYNKITQGKERLILAGSPQEATGASLNRQWTANGDVDITPSRFLSGKTGVNPRNASVAVPATLVIASVTTSGIVSPFLINQVFQYFVTSSNEGGGESAKITGSVTILANGDEVTLTIGFPSSGVPRYYNVYRSLAGGSQASAKFIGKIKAPVSGTVVFHDLGSKIPGFVTGVLVEKGQNELRELAPFTRKQMPMNELTHPEIFYRFVCAVSLQPRKMALADNLAS